LKNNNYSTNSSNKLKFACTGNFTASNEEKNTLNTLRKKISDDKLISSDFSNFNNNLLNPEECLNTPSISLDFSNNNHNSGKLKEFSSSYFNTNHNNNLHFKLSNDVNHFNKSNKGFPYFQNTPNRNATKINFYTQSFNKFPFSQNSFSLDPYGNVLNSQQQIFKLSQKFENPNRSISQISYLNNNLLLSNYSEDKYIINNITNLLKDQNGCRVLQKKLDEKNVEFGNIFLEKVFYIFVTEILDCIHNKRPDKRPIW